MTRLKNILQDHISKRLNMGGSDLEPRLQAFANDFRYGYLFQLALVLVIFVLTVVAVALIWRDSTAIAALFGALGMGGVGWFLREVRTSMREYALVQVLTEASRSMPQDKLDALVELIINRMPA